MKIYGINTQKLLSGEMFQTDNYNNFNKKLTSQQQQFKKFVNHKLDKEFEYNKENFTFNNSNNIFEQLWRKQKLISDEQERLNGKQVINFNINQKEKFAKGLEKLQKIYKQNNAKISFLHKMHMIKLLSQFQSFLKMRCLKNIFRVVSIQKQKLLFSSFIKLRMIFIMSKNQTKKNIDCHFNIEDSKDGFKSIVATHKRNKLYAIENEISPIQQMDSNIYNSQYNCENIHQLIVFFNVIQKKIQLNCGYLAIARFANQRKKNNQKLNTSVLAKNLRFESTLCDTKNLIESADKFKSIKAISKNLAKFNIKKIIVEKKKTSDNEQCVILDNKYSEVLQKQKDQNNVDSQQNNGLQNFRMQNDNFISEVLESAVDKNIDLPQPFYQSLNEPEQNKFIKKNKNCDKTGKIKSQRSASIGQVRNQVKRIQKNIELNKNKTVKNFNDLQKNIQNKKSKQDINFQQFSKINDKLLQQKEKFRSLSITSRDYSTIRSTKISSTLQIQKSDKNCQQNYKQMQIQKRIDTLKQLLENQFK